MWRILVIWAVSLLLYSTANADPSNICKLVSDHPDWYEAALDTQEKWGVPVSVQFAIMHTESSFDANAKNPKSTAYGYAQALDKTWQGYKQSAGNKGSKRNHFDDASDFIGWYAKQVKNEIGIQSDDAYDLYIAYHDGSGGYKKAVKNSHSLAAKLAKTVQNNADRYEDQLALCDSPPPNSRDSNEFS